jgi:hypothetical protein
MRLFGFKAVLDAPPPAVAIDWYLLPVLNFSAVHDVSLFSWFLLRHGRRCSFYVTTYERSQGS